MPDIVHGEMLSICESIFIVLQAAKRGEIRNITVKVFNDNWTCQNILKDGASLSLDRDLVPIVEAIIWASHQLQRYGCDAELHYIPGHRHHVVPHCIADLASRDQHTGGSEAKTRYGFQCPDGWVYDDSRFSNSMAYRLGF